MRYFLHCVSETATNNPEHIAATQHLATLKKIDPKVYKTAETFFVVKPSRATP